MRTTIIPAQITTVEDRIAGNLNLTQIILLLIPLFITTFIYTVLPVTLHLTLYKLPLIFLAFIVCAILALRIKQRVVLQWIIILLRYNLRPRYFIFNKNDVSFRNVILSEPKLKTKATSQKVAKENIKLVSPNIADLIKLEQLIINPKANINFKFAKNGGINVGITEEK